MSALQGKLILGNIDVTSLFLGNNEVSAVYIGNLQIWPDNSEPDESTLFTETNSEGIEYPYVNEITQKYIDVDELIHYDTTDCLKPDKQSGDVSWYLKTETDGENGGLIQINNIIHYDTTDCLKLDKQSGDVSWYLKTETDGENGGLIQINNS